MKKAAIQISMSFLIMLIISIVIFTMGIFFINKFFTKAEGIKLVFDEKTSAEIERLLDDGSRVAIPFDKKTIRNGNFDTFGVGVLNMEDISPANFKVKVRFNKAVRDSDTICERSYNPPQALGQFCGDPNVWLRTSKGQGTVENGVEIERNIKKYDQTKFLIGVAVKDAPQATYIFDVITQYDDGGVWREYDTTHKIYLEVP